MNHILFLTGKGGQMKNKAICKVCGFIIEQQKLGEVCPACGVPKSAFEGYNDKVSEKRRKILDLNLHSMTIHFPQAISVMIFGLLLLHLLFFYRSPFNLLSCSQVLSVLLPLSVLAAATTGLLVGKTQFKKLNTPILKLKITVAILFFFLSSILSVLIIFGSPLVSWLHLILNGIFVLFSIILGENGGKLMGLAVPN